MTPIQMDTSATFSADRLHRFSLKRVWDNSKPLLGYVLLNPSTADEYTNDPTIERCVRRAQMLGYGGCIIVNIFSYRSTDPKELYHKEDVRLLSLLSNNVAIIQAAHKCDKIICGWGQHGGLYGRGQEVLKMLIDIGVTPQVLRMNKDGSPAHPLYIGYKVQPFDFPVKMLSNIKYETGK